MNIELQSKRLMEIITRERAAGCPMAGESLVPVAIRRWKTFDRRHKKTKSVTLNHRANDLLKIFLKQYPDFGYDESCLKHLAESFSLALWSTIDDTSSANIDLSPRSCSACGLSLFSAYGLIGHWSGAGGSGDMIGAVCDNCGSAFASKVHGLPTSRDQWTIDETPSWID